VNDVPKPSVSDHSAARRVLVAIVIFVVAHFAFLVKVSSPDKFYFDEVHYVPAARQMLAADPSAGVLNPMHPPLAKQLIALSILSFGDSPLGWRYAGVLFGALAIVAVYFCGLVLFAAPGPAVAASLIAFFNQMVFVQSRIAMLDIFALTFGLFAIAAFMHGFRQQRPNLWFGVSGLFSGLSIASKWSGLFVLATCIAIIAVIRLLQRWRTVFGEANADDWYRPDLWPDFRFWRLATCFVLLPGVVYFSTFLPLYGFSISDILEAQRRIFADNTTTAIEGHTYMSSWPSWPFLTRPVWYLRQNRRGSRRGDRHARQSAGAVAGLGCARGLPARRCGKTPMGRVPDRLVLSRVLFGVVVAAADTRVPLLLSAAGNDREPRAGLSVEAWELSALVALGLRRGGVCRLYRHAADLGRVRGNVDGEFQPADDFPELDLSHISAIHRFDSANVIRVTLIGEGRAAPGKASVVVQKSASLLPPVRHADF
jgi:hypothetical protein